MTFCYPVMVDIFIVCPFGYCDSCCYEYLCTDFLCGHMFSSLLRLFLGVEFLGCVVFTDRFHLLSPRPRPCPFWARHPGPCHALAQTRPFSLARVGNCSSPNTPHPDASCLFTCHPPPWCGLLFSNLRSWVTPSRFRSGITINWGFCNEQSKSSLSWSSCQNEGNRQKGI